MCYWRDFPPNPSGHYPQILQEGSKENYSWMVLHVEVIFQDTSPKNAKRGNTWAIYLGGSPDPHCPQTTPIHLENCEEGFEEVNDATLVRSLQERGGIDRHYMKGAAVELIRKRFEVTLP